MRRIDLSTVDENSDLLIDREVPITNETNRSWKRGWISVPENRMDPFQNQLNAHLSYESLIFYGQFDPWTPVWYGTQVMQYVPNAKHLIYPGHSHLPGFTKKGFDDIYEFISGLEGE